MHEGIAIGLWLGAMALIVTLMFGMESSGVGSENRRLYEKCLVEKQEMMYNKAIEYCKERVK